MNSHSSSEEELFNHALALPAADRAAFLDRACAGDPALRERVESLLHAHDATGSFLKSAAPGLGETVAAFAPRPEEKAGDRIGRYKLLQQIGEGGCGVVYMAEQTEPVIRRVALKVIKLGMDTKAVIARFEAERQALAMMDHPNIAKVLDAGTTDNGRPFFVMELVRGIPITKYCDENNLSTADRLGLFDLVCHAIQHAHQKGIIHRDIKPSNILVTVNDGQPVPKVIDFGIAKATQGRLTDATVFTAFEQFIGTPAYMSPEQAEMSSLDIDTRSDIYSLGVLLYELLTGRTPFDPKELLLAGLDEMRRQIREVEPAKPSTRLGALEKSALTTTAQRRRTDAPKLIRLIDGDLDWIVMKALEKDRTRRYETATNLAQDVRRHLDNEPIVAHPPTTAYRLGKAIRRNKVAFGTGAAVAVSLATGLVVATVAYLKEKAAHEFAVQSVEARQEDLAQIQQNQKEAQLSSRESRANDKKARIETARNAYTLPLLKEIFKEVGAGSLSVTDHARLVQALDQTAGQLNRDSAIPPESRNDLLETLGDAYMDLGAFGRAEPMFRELLALRRKMPGDLNMPGAGLMRPDTAAALDKLIEALKRQGKSAEAEAEREGAQAKESQFLRTGEGAYYLRNRGHVLLQEGKYAEAEARLRAAKDVLKDGEWGVDRAITLDTEIMFVRFQAGDLAGAKTLAMDLLHRTKRERWWTVLDDRNVSGSGGALDWASSKANMLLGRIALREGDRAAAKNHLLGAITSGGENYLWGWQHLDLDLPAEMVAAGERTTVLRFVDAVKNSEAEWETGAEWASWTAYDNPIYEREAWAHESAISYDQLKKDIAAGKVPDDWQKQLSPPPQAMAVTALKPLPARPDTAARQIGFLLTQLQYPLCFQMAGWLLAIPLWRRRPRVLGGLSLRTACWLSALGALSVFEGALLLTLYYGAFGFALRVIFQAFCFQGLFALAAGTALWETRRALREESAVGRMTLLLRGSLVFLAAFFVLKAALNNLSNSDPIAPDYIYFISVFVSPLLWVTAIVIFLGVAWEAWRWTKCNALLPSRTKWFLYLAAPILGAQVVANSWPFLAGVHFIGRPWAILLLWLNVLLPWLLVGGFFAGKPAGRPAAPVPSPA